LNSSPLEGAAEQETSGLPDPPASTGDEGFDNATAELDHDISELPDSPIQSLSLLSAQIGSPVIDPSQSKSVTKVAIENVAKAGYLNIFNATAVEVDNQVLQHLKKASGSQPGGNANSKRKREEIEQGQGPNEVKQKPEKKRQAVPTREQSSRYATSSKFFIGFTDIFHFLLASKTPTIRTSTSLSAPVRLTNRPPKLIAEKLKPLLTKYFMCEPSGKHEPRWVEARLTLLMVYEAHQRARRKKSKAHSLSFIPVLLNPQAVLVSLW